MSQKCEICAILFSGHCATFSMRDIIFHRSIYCTQASYLGYWNLLEALERCVRAWLIGRWTVDCGS